MSNRQAHRLLLVVGAMGGVILVCLLVLLLYLSGYIRTYHPQYATLVSNNPQKLLAEADFLAYVGNWQKARPYFAKAEHLFAQRGDERDALYAKVSCLRANVEKGSYATADRYLSKLLKNPVVQNDPRLRLRCLTVKGIVDLNTNTIDAERDWAEALKVATSLHNLTWETRAKGWLGIVDYVNGNTSGAGAKVISAIAQATLHRDFRAQVDFLTFLSDGLTEDGMPREGMAAANQALARNRTIPDAPFPYHTYIAKVGAFAALRRYGEARALIASTLEHARKAGILGAEADLLREAGRLEEEADNDLMAKQYFDQTASVAAKAHLPRIVGDAMFRLAGLYRREGNLPRAEKCMAKGIVVVQEVEAPYMEPHYLAVEAELEAADGKYKQADALFSQAADLVDAMLVNVPTPTLESSLLGTMSKIYVEHFQLAVNALKDKDKAFQIVESTRGRAMADALHDHRHLRADAVKDTDPTAVEISNLQRNLLQQETPAERSRLLADLFEAEIRLAGAEDEHLQFEKRVLSNPVSLGDLERSLRPDEMVLEYVLADPHSYCFVITHYMTTIETLAGRTQMGGTIDRYLQKIKAKKSDHQDAKRLYTWLLQSCLAQQNRRRLIIIPDGKLNDIPFGALMDPARRYLAESHVVSIAPSGTVLYMLRHEVQPRPRYTFLGVGYAKRPSPGASSKGFPSELAGAVRGVFDLSNPTIGPIPYTGEEVKFAAAAMGHGSVVLLGKQATEEKLKTEPLDDFAILHFAVHDILNTQEPDRSALLFGDGPHSSADGLWQAREIRTLSLKADLVVLSSCDTGIGKIEGEEGVDSLVGAFLMAGSKNVVASLWPVNDRYTTTLMEKFYTHLAQRMDVATALDRAEMDILQDYGHETPPYYWAAFEIIGQAEGKISFPNGKSYEALKN